MEPMLRHCNWILSVFILLPLLQNGIAFGRPNIVIRYLRRNLKENADIGLPIATVQAISPPTTRTSCRLTGKYSHLFSLRQQSPVFYAIVIRIPLDYEREQRVHFNVNCREVGGDPLNFSVNEITINVIDQNDHSPIIRESRVARQVQEGSPPDTLVSVIKVIDRDSGSAGRVSCFMSSTTPRDSLRLLTMSNNTFTLKTSIVFDRELTAAIRFTILCSDNGVPPLESTYSQVIGIADVDDNTPVFPRSIYTANIPENRPHGIQLLRLSASDRDVDNVIQYELSSNDVPFRIDRNTGKLYTTRMLDRERRSKYTFRVLAVSGARNSERKRTGSATVRVTVSDENDNMPMFPVPRYVFKVNKTQRVVGRVMAFDADDGRNADIKYRMDWVPGFSVNERTGVIYRNTKIKPETRTVNFFISAINLELVSKIEVEVNFSLPVHRLKIISSTVSPQTNKTDRRTKIVGGVTKSKNALIAFHYWFFVNEDEPAGTILGKIVATGAENITYHLQSNGIKWLKLDSVTGVLSTATKIDRETMKDANVSVVASYPPEYSKATRRVMVSINDINDCTPKFKTNRLTISVPEGYHNSTIINGTSASDCDVTSPNNKISYRILQSKFAKFFQISKDGRLELKNGTFDRENSGFINISLIATDGGSPMRSSTMNVTIKLIDVNDNAPSWMFPFSNETTMYVRKSTLPGTYVVALVARDLDAGKNGIIVYDFVKPSPDLPFKINRKHGIIKTSRTLTEKDLKSHRIILQAKDLGTPSKQSLMILNLIVKKIY